jgi:adenylosuccinate synthase
LASYITDTRPTLRKAARSGSQVILEGQLGALRDVNLGIYPYTTSSSTLAGTAGTGAGIPEVAVERVVGVMKAFSSCVGSGPFVTEMPEDEAAVLRDLASEFGAVTGRPRRLGHFDAVASRYGVEIQGVGEVALTKLDTLSGLDPLRICTDYVVDGRATRTFPLTPALDAADARYETCAGWNEDVSTVREFDDLPAAAQRYVEAIESHVGCYVRYVSVGPAREQLIDRGERL